MKELFAFVSFLAAAALLRLVDQRSVKVATGRELAQSVAADIPVGSTIYYWEAAERPEDDEPSPRRDVVLSGTAEELASQLGLSKQQFEEYLRTGTIRGGGGE